MAEHGGACLRHAGGHGIPDLATALLMHVKIRT